MRVDDVSVFLSDFSKKNNFRQTRDQEPRETINFDDFGDIASFVFPKSRTLVTSSPRCWRKCMRVDDVSVFLSEFSKKKSPDARPGAS